jgi:hypothetical protein
MRIPDSPKYLHSIGDYDAARFALARIAGVNGIVSYKKEFKF